MSFLALSAHQLKQADKAREWGEKAEGEISAALARKSDYPAVSDWRKRLQYQWLCKELEDYLVFGLMDFDDIDYNGDGVLLYKLAGQLVSHLRS